MLSHINRRGFIGRREIIHDQLVAAGQRVAYAAEAVVLAEMPVSLRQAHSQNVRWERGRLQLLRSYGFRLLVDAIRLRDPRRIDPLRHIFEAAMSGVISGAAALAFGAWLFIEIASRM